MSTHSDPSSDFDLWDVVCCSKCLLPFLSKTGPTIPFWLTECGHVLCNNHLSPDQSCSHCGVHGIQLVPLQKEMEAPMSDWFRAIPLALDSIVYSVKFQQEMMAAQIISLRSRCQQQRMLIDRLKAENLDLKKINEELRNVGSGLHYPTAITEYPSDSINSNGKRPWNVPHQSGERISQSRTTTRSFAVDSAVPEKSLHSRQQILSSGFPPNEHGFCEGLQHDTGDTMHEVARTDQLAKQYAYNGPPTLQYKPPPLSRAQAAPLAYQQRNQYAKNIGNPPISTVDNNQNDFATQIRPPSRFRPAKKPHNPLGQAVDIATSSKFQRAAEQEVKRMRTMGPPPTPQGLRPHRVQDARQSNPNNNGFPSIVTNRFLPSSNGHVSNTPTSNNRPPPTSLNGKSQHPPHASHKTTNLGISGSAINPGRENGS